MIDFAFVDVSVVVEAEDNDVLNFSELVWYNWVVF